MQCIKRLFKHLTKKTKKSFGPLKGTQSLKRLYKRDLRFWRMSTTCCGYLGFLASRPLRNLNKLSISIVWNRAWIETVMQQHYPVPFAAIIRIWVKNLIALSKVNIFLCRAYIFGKKCYLSTHLWIICSGVM